MSRGVVRTRAVETAKRALGADRARQLRRVERRWRAIWELSRPRDHLFVCSHMRSYSSLLCHLLASADEVCGYTEMRRSYRTDADLLALTWQVRASHDSRLRGSTVLDKILHTTHTIDDEVLAYPGVQLLVSARSPEPTLRSIVAMGRGIAPDHHWSDPELALEHYLDRLEQLADLARRGPKVSVLRPEALIETTDATLASLGTALGLKRPLTADYAVRSYSGKAEYGDTSTYLQQGRIIAERDEHREVSLEGVDLAQAHDAYAAFWSEIGELGLSVIGGVPASRPT